MKDFKETIEEALDLINEEDYAQALSLLEKVVNNDTSDIEVYKNIGLCEINLDDPSSAKNAFLKALELDNSDTLSLYYLANCYSRTGEKELAIKNFEKVLELRPDYLDVYKALGMMYIEYSRADDAIKLMQRAFENENIENDYSLYYVCATAYMLKTDYTNAAKNLEKALELNPSHTQIANSLAVCYLNISEFKKALAVLEKALKVDEKNALTNYNLGVLYQTMCDFKTALKYFQASYQLEPSVTMLSTIANCALKAGELNLASSLYENLVMAYPNNSDYRLAYVEICEQTENYEKALENIDMLLSMDEKNVILIKKKGAFLRKLHRYIESIDIFSSLLKRGKIDIEVYYNLAFNYVETGDYDTAKEMFKKCIILEPQNPYAHKDLGVLYLKMNCYDWAVDEMEQAIKLESNVAEFHCSLGVAYLMLSRVPDARAAFIEAINHDNNDADSYAYLGYTYLLDRNFENALKNLQKALEIDSTHFLAKTYLAKYYFILEKYDVLKQILLDVVEQVQDEETMNMLAIAYLETGEFEPAMGIFSKLAISYPDNHIVLTNLAKCEFHCNKKNEALEHLRQALMIFDDFEPAIKLLKEINNGN